MCWLEMLALRGGIEQLQLEDKLWMPVSFFSKTLTATLRRYSTFDRELLAIKLATRKFRHILNAIPPITRVFVTLSVVLGGLVSLGICSEMAFYFNLRLIIDQG